MVSGAKHLGYGGRNDKGGNSIEAKRLEGKRLGGNVLGAKHLVTDVTSRPAPADPFYCFVDSEAKSEWFIVYMSN